MPTSTNVTNLKINELTEAQYDAAVLAGTIGPNEISIITDAETGGAQYEYTAELEFTPNVDSEGAIIIELAADNVATLQIGQYVSYEDGGVWDDPVEDAVYTAFMQPSLDTSVGASKILWTSPVNRLIYMEGYAGTGQNEESILTLKYQYNDSGLAEDHCKIVLKIISDKELTITATKDSGEFVTDTDAGIMSLPIPLYEESDQTQFYPVQQGGLINWQPIPQVDSLPSQTGNAGKFLTTDGTSPSWSDKPLVNGTTSRDSLNILGSTVPAVGAIAIGVNSEIRSGAYGEYAIAIGYGAKGWWQGGVAIGYDTSAINVAIGYTAKSTASGSIAIGNSTQATGQQSVAIGGIGTKATANYAVQLGGANQTNSDANTFKVGNQNGNFEMMSADGTIPEARLADTTNATQGQVLTLDANNNAVWQTPSTSVTTASATLAVADWSSNTQTITVNGVTSSNVVIVSPQPLSATDYAAAGILCTGQAANSLTFTCTATPSTAISLSIVIIG